MTTENSEISTEGLPEDLKKAVELACNSIELSGMESNGVFSIIRLLTQYFVFNQFQKNKNIPSQAD